MKIKEGDKVRIVKREVTDADLVSNKYYEHMQGLTGVVANIYSKDDIAVQINLEGLSDETRKAVKSATKRMHKKLEEQLSEVQKKELTKEEMEFDVHFVSLISAEDLEKV
jgi:predicted DNA-binding antitoxin AbrB/MazE fold protein